MSPGSCQNALLDPLRSGRVIKMVVVISQLNPHGSVRVCKCVKFPCSELKLATRDLLTEWIHGMGHVVTKFVLNRKVHFVQVMDAQKWAVCKHK